MKPEHKQAWVDALRSGKYEKGTGYLRQRKGSGDRFCCLGVLIDVLTPEHWVGVPNEDGTLGPRWADGQPFRDCMPSEATCEELDLDFALAEDLASRNDAGDTFASIASTIENVA